MYIFIKQTLQLFSMFSEIIILYTINSSIMKLIKTHRSLNSFISMNTLLAISHFTLKSFSIIWVTYYIKV